MKRNFYHMLKIGCLVLFAIFCMSMSSGAQTVEELSTEGRRHFKCAMAYKEEAKSNSDYSLVISELLKVCETDESAEVYIELGRCYSLFPTTEAETKAEECFNEAMRLAPDRRDEILDEMAMAEVRKNIKEKKFWEKLEGAWSPDGTKHNPYMFEISKSVNGNNIFRAPASCAYDERYDIFWIHRLQNVSINYWPDFGFYSIEYNLLSISDDDKLTYSIQLTISNDDAIFVSENRIIISRKINGVYSERAEYTKIE